MGGDILVMKTDPIWAILLAGGVGSRYTPGKSKLLEPLDGKTVFQRSFETIYKLDALTGMVVVSHPEWRTAYESNITFSQIGKPLLWVEGGETRRDSVWNALMALPEDAEIVLIHDAARPMVTAERIQAALQPVLEGAVLGTSLGIPMADSLKQVVPDASGWVEKTLDRSRIWAVHTPQVFRKAAIVQAHEEASKDGPAYDDAELLEQLYPEQPVVLMVEDDRFNLKITTPSDLQCCKALLVSRLNDTPSFISYT
jgi:2-C-methyl-D-erythritol 4-phosphate cytidylyltransferase